MKKYLLIIAVALFTLVSFSSCDKKEEKKTLIGTIWSGKGSDGSLTITFVTATTGTEKWKSDYDSDTYDFTYIYNDPTVIITDEDGYNEMGVISGNTLTIYGMELTKR